MEGLALGGSIVVLSHSIVSVKHRIFMSALSYRYGLRSYHFFESLAQYLAIVLAACGADAKMWSSVRCVPRATRKLQGRSVQRYLP